MESESVEEGREPFHEDENHHRDCSPGCKYQKQHDSAHVAVKAESHPHNHGPQHLRQL